MCAGGGLSPSSARYSCAESDSTLSSRASQLLSSTQHLLNELRSTCGSLARQAESIELECGTPTPGAGPSPGPSPLLAPFGFGLAFPGSSGGAQDLAQELAQLGMTASGMRLQQLQPPAPASASASQAGSQARLSTSTANASASGLGSQKGLAGSRGQLPPLHGQSPSWPASPARTTCPGGGAGSVLGSLPSLIEHTDADAEAEEGGEGDGEGDEEEDELATESEKSATIRRRTGPVSAATRTLRVSECSTSTLKRDSYGEQFTQTEAAATTCSSTSLSTSTDAHAPSQSQSLLALSVLVSPLPEHQKPQKAQILSDVTLRTSTSMRPVPAIAVTECASQTEAAAASASAPCTPRRHSRPVSTLSFDVELVPKPMLDELRAQINALMVRD